MFNFTKGKKKTEEKAAQAEDILQENEDLEAADDTTLETVLSIPENWKLTEEERYVYAFHNTQSPNLQANQISIYGMELLKTKKALDVTGLIRSTVTKSIKFGETAVLLLDGNREPVARRTFDLSKLESIPANSARPWTFKFLHDDIFGDIDNLGNDWSLAFELKKSHQLDLEKSWEKSIAEQTRASLEKIVKDAPALKPGEVNFMGIQAKKQENGDLAVTVLVRNGAEKNIQLEQIPLGLKDASGDEIARGSFKMDDFTVKANTSKPWTFIFPASMLTKNQINLTKWTTYPIQGDKGT
ncbi:accessory Sec system S-layer assembly protein [Lentibacillus persicus]|uniref:Accessory Sec system S-layer assembly protein n=1 Tax=Lentibacillus persicus TaxID=640948 RepID=A0A1I1VUB8_9BACI|nr:accessory Sec system S-layer assembly protein [Lentibacillus persicus]SFD86627.1 accessory Sec system S-layer assembly protein [Lentibacillus persicus]